MGLFRRNKLCLLVNLAIRLSIIYFLGEVLLFPDDPRFAGKAIPIRNLIIVLSLSLLFPALHWLKGHFRLPPGRWKAPSPSRWKGWKAYPWWFDNIYLSIFWLDMAGNSFNLYDTFFYFDLIPHFHGTGAIAAVLFGAFSLTFWGAVGLANIVHMLLEAQEYYTDALVGTHNVRGLFDTVNDLVVGILGAVVYTTVIYFMYKKARSEIS